MKTFSEESGSTELPGKGPKSSVSSIDHVHSQIFTCPPTSFFFFRVDVYSRWFWHETDQKTFPIAEKLWEAYMQEPWCS